VSITSKRLKGLMAERDITLLELSGKMGISENDLRLKINGLADWLFSELVFVVDCLGFSEVREVFPELYNHVLNTG